jgi:S1-C subfamily serine protease
MRKSTKLEKFLGDHLGKVVVGLCIIAALFMSVGAIAAPFSPAEMAIRLSASTAELRGCTATKIGARMWLTAGHCINADSRVETLNGYLYPRSITVALQDKDGNRKEDWAIVNTSTEDRTIPTLPLGCNDTIYPGMPVAYLGYPGQTDRAFIMGYVSTMRQVRNYGRNNADWVLDLPVAGGASGAAVVSMDTGNIVGIVTEGVAAPRTGFFMAAAESVKNLDWCEDENARMKHQDDDVDETDVIPATQAKDVGHT